DAATKVTDRIRRRCYNCYTSDTSTWRRSNLAVGKVVSAITLSFTSLLKHPISSVTNAVCSSELILVPVQNNF
ncbi:hypothetical protein GYMLUDRAFT_104000, partial [Collybiopsis luxurians FD-317 M1]